MKILAKVSLVFVVSVFSCSTQLKTDLRIEQYAINIILLSEKLEELTLDSSKYRISEEVCSFYELGLFFREHLLEEDFNLLDFADIRNFNVTRQKKLKSLSSSPGAKLQFFFSRETKGYFIVEVFYTGIRKMKRNQIPPTGYSIAYLFRLEGQEVQLIDTAELLYG